MGKIELVFEDLPGVSDECLLIFPFESDSARYVERTGIPVAGWQTVALKSFVRRAFFELYPRMRIISPAERFAVVHRILLDSDFLADKKYLERTGKIAVAESLVELFVMLDESGIFTPEQIEQVSQNSGSERTRQALKLYKAFREDLAARGLVTVGESYIKIAEALREGKIPSPLRGKKRIVFANFLEFSVPQQELIRALAEKFDVTVSIPLSPGHYPSQWRRLLVNLAKAFGARADFPKRADGHWLAAALDGNPEPARSVLAFENEFPDAAIAKFPDPAREVEFVARAAKYLMAAKNIPPSEIFVVTPNPDRYLPLMSALFEEMGIPLDVSGSTGAQVVAPQRFLFLLLDAVFSKWRRQETLAFLSHPAMRVALERMGTSYDEVRSLTYTRRLVSLDRWKEFINDEHLGKVAGMLIKLDEVLAKKPAGVEETLEKIGGTVDVEGILRSLDSRRRQYFLAQWHQLIDTARMLDSGYGGRTELDGKLSISALLHTFRPSEFGAKPYSAGVRVLPVEEGRANFGEATFFVGFNGENFPPKTHKNAVLEKEYDDFLPFVSRREEIAKVSLLVGMMTARRSYLTIPLMDEQNLFVPQVIDEIFRFTEAEKITNGEKIFRMLDRYVLFSRDTFKISKETQQYVVYSIPEVVENLVQGEISVSDIEDYTECPVKFYLNRMLGALAPEELEETISSLELGSEIHSAFERFFKEKYARAGISLPKLDTYSIKNFDVIKDFLKYLTDNFSNIYDKIKVTNDDIELLREIFGEEVSYIKWRDKNLPYTLTDIFEIEKYLLPNLHHIPEFEEKMIGGEIGTSNLPALFETKILCEIDGTLIRGKIDRIDLLPSGKVVIIDYKFGDITRKIDSKWEKEIQLKTYATMLYKAGIPVEGIMYYHNLRSINRIVISYHPIAEEEITEFEKNLIAVVSDLREGVIKRDLKWGSIEPSKNCRRCELAEICPYNTR